jgi:hypothetical protein
MIIKSDCRDCQLIMDRVIKCQNLGDLRSARVHQRLLDQHIKNDHAKTPVVTWKGGTQWLVK